MTSRGLDVRWNLSNGFSQSPEQGVLVLSAYGAGYTKEHGERLRKIHARLVEARRELDALIGDAYLRPRANIVPVHFLDLASAVEKLRWAEKEWRELDRQLAEGEDHPEGGIGDPSAGSDEEGEEPHPGDLLEAAQSRR